MWEMTKNRQDLRTLVGVWATMTAGWTLLISGDDVVSARNIGYAVLGTTAVCSVGEFPSFSNFYVNQKRKEERITNNIINVKVNIYKLQNGTKWNKRLNNIWEKEQQSTSKSFVLLSFCTWEGKVMYIISIYDINRSMLYMDSPQICVSAVYRIGMLLTRRQHLCMIWVLV